MQSVAVRCSMLQYVVVCCSVLHCSRADCCSVSQYGVSSLEQCVAVCCSVSQSVAVCSNVLQYGAVCCSALQCVAVCCSVLQIFAMCCSGL